MSSKGKKSINFNQIKTYPLNSRDSKVKTTDFASVYQKGGSFQKFINSLPNILAAKDFKEIVEAIIKAYKKQKPVICALGAHVIKCGLSPVLIDLMKKGVITLLAMNGAGIIHDFEIAMVGKTSEDVTAELPGGNFGMAKETGEIINQAICDGVKKGLGIGESIGKKIVELATPFADYSLLAAGIKYDIPITVHVAIGTDIIHIHPMADGAAIGEGSYLDFKTFATNISDLEGGVYLNIGSAVILPEVFLKALTVVRNLGYEVKNFTTVNMDFIQHYRPNQNVVRRPVVGGGKGYSITGHHELMLPLLAAAIIEKLGD